MRLYQSFLSFSYRCFRYVIKWIFKLLLGLKFECWIVSLGILGPEFSWFFIFSLKGFDGFLTSIGVFCKGWFIRRCRVNYNIGTIPVVSFKISSCFLTLESELNLCHCFLFVLPSPGMYYKTTTQSTLKRPMHERGLGFPTWQYE